MSVQQEFWRKQQEELKFKLGEFEQAVEVPFIPGELDNWLKTAREKFERLRPQLQLQTQHIHADEFAEIAEEDPGLLGRVESMREEDREIMAECREIADRLEKLCEEKEKGASETDLKEDLDRFVSLSLDFVTRIRKQEVTLRTWFVEAFNRDRGTVD